VYAKSRTFQLTVLYEACFSCYSWERLTIVHLHTVSLTVGVSFTFKIPLSCCNDNFVFHILYHLLFIVLIVIVMLYLNGFTA